MSLVKEVEAKGHGDNKVMGLLNAYVLYRQLEKDLEKVLREYVKTGVLNDKAANIGRAEKCACPTTKGKSPANCPRG